VRETNLFPQAVRLRGRGWMQLPASSRSIAGGQPVVLINGSGTAAVMQHACRAMSRGRRCLRLVPHSALFMVLRVIPFINIG